eukprot:TRINITY_DN48965_c0_g1_i1.p1 TRINITY_DN48965_c0_g1~~TRINITY_DN48965_c0_g1_i1.p1  ORF type:complete len:399 (-),score=82.47 TRINITY_DN48965_c0_g1_i1:46-1242(-)
MNAWLYALFLAQLPAFLSPSEAADVAPSSSGRSVVVTIATDDYHARGAIVTLHSIRLHSQPSGASSIADFAVLVPKPAPGQRALSSTWRKRFATLGVRIVDVAQVNPSPAIQAAMDSDRGRMAQEGLLEVLQPVPYGGAFAKVHAFDPALFGNYSKVLLVDGDVLAKRDLQGLLALEPLSAGRDLMDAFNYGVLVLRPDADIHKALVRLLANATKEDVDRYNSRRPQETGFCDQTLVAGYLAAHHGPIHFLEDLRKKTRKDPSSWLLSTEYNLVVSYRATERCESKRERPRVDAARIVHFANGWLNFVALAKDREAPGRIDSPRCYRAAFRYWHDVYHHALAVAAAGAGATPPPVPTYRSTGAEEDAPMAPEEVQRVFLDFQSRTQSHATLAHGGEEL